MLRRLSLLFLAFFLVVGSAQAIIKALTPLQSFLSDSTFIVVAKVEKLFPDKPAMVLIVEEDLKGKAPFRRLPVNLEGDKEAEKEKHVPQLLKRFGPDAQVILFFNQRGKRVTTFAYINGTWFQVLGQKTGEDSFAWSLTHGEPYLRRTFKGTTGELKTLLIDCLDGKKKPPEPNEKEKPGFGPEFEKKSSSRFPGGIGGMRLFAVIPTLGVGGPLAILAILFPAVFGGVLVLFRQWIAFITLFSINSTLLLLYAVLGGTFRGSWISEQTPLFLVMGTASLLCFLWAWRRQVFNVSMGPAAIETPERTENIVLTVFSFILLAVMGLLLWLTNGDILEINNKAFLVLAIGVWVATLVKGVKSLIPRRGMSVPLSTEGIMIAGTLISSLGFIMFRSSEVNATVFAGDAGGELVIKYSGKERWKYVTKESGVFVSNPLVDGDRVYAASAHPTFRFGILHCIDRDTGKPVWTFDDEGDMKQVYSSPTVADGRLYIGEGFHDDPDCKLYCIEAKTGKKIWAFSTKGQTESSPTVALDRVFFGAGNGAFFCLDAKNGKELWSYPAKDSKGRLLRFCGSPAVVQGRVYTGTGVDRNQPEDKGETAVFSLDARTGKEIWKTPVPLPCWGAPVVDGNLVYITLGNGDIIADADSYDPKVENKGAVWCLETETGKVIWKKEVSNGVLNEVVLDDRNVYFGSRSGHCFCLDRRDGTQKWKTDMGSPVVGAPSLARLGARSESVFVVATFGRWAALEPETGKIQWAFAIEGECHFTATPRHLLTRKGRQIFIGGAVSGDVTRGKATLFCLDDGVSER